MITLYEKINKQLEVEYTYTSFDLLQNKPCYIEDCGYIHPIKVEDYALFIKLSKYLGLNRVNMELPNEISLLQAMILIFTRGVDNSFVDDNFDIIIRDLCGLFTLASGDEVEVKINDGDISFVGLNGDFCVNSKNFELVRIIIMKQNLLSEPLHFKDKLTEKWYYKAKKAEQKARGDNNSDIDDIILTVSEAMKFSLNDILKFNIFQLNSYYARIVQSVHYETISKYRCVGEVKSRLEYTDPVIPSLFKQESLSDVLMNKEGLTGMLS